MKDKAFIGASLVAGIAASLCCILPIVFASIGAGIVGASTFFETWRPLLLGVTFALLALGFYFAYRKPKHSCTPGSACERPEVHRAGRIWLWIATAFVVVFAAFPYYSGAVASIILRDRSAPNQTSALQPKRLTHVRVVIEGMTCAACAKSVESKLKELKGVESVRVSYQTGTADVEFDPAVVTLQQLQKAIQDAGYRTQTT
jgi:mercuric ion transport protein